MRTIQIFVLRLLVDSDQPDTLHGLVRRVSDNTEQSFTDEAMLIAALRHWLNRSRSVFDQNHIDRRVA